jgi:hypothetical protein
MQNLSDAENLALCHKFGVCCYVVGEVFSVREVGTAIPDEDLHKWFVAVPAAMNVDELLAQIPLANTEEEALALAVKHLGLQTMVVQ